jgi:hypothetical protein
MDKLQPYLVKLDTELCKCDFLVEIESKSKVPKTHIVLVVWLLYTVSVVSGYGAAWTTTLLGLSLPTLQAAQQWQSNLKPWVLYFLLWSSVSFLEHLCNLPLTKALVRIPFYWLIKSAAILWLTLPHLK